LDCGEENTKHFQAYAKGRKLYNTIWSLNDIDGRTISSFEGLAHLGKRHFHNLFKEYERVNIANIVRMSLYFPSFVNEEDNTTLMEEFYAEYLKEVLQSF
jgi:hypothetical protein